MSDDVATFDLVVVGGGPAGQKAAIQGAKLGRRTLMIEEQLQVGGECVARGTIPSKTLRETAVALAGVRQRTETLVSVALDPGTALASLMSRKDAVRGAHERYMGEQLRRNGVTRWHGRARFEGPHDLVVTEIHGAKRRARADVVVVATGSRPRDPGNVSVDHEHILDSDSILGMTYLPRSLTVLGAGVIACEYASIFAALGVQVTLVDKAPRPLGFLDEECVARFQRAFERAGGRFLGGRYAREAAFDGVDAVCVTLDDGSELSSEKVLVTLGRVARVEGLGLDRAGVAVDARGLVVVDAKGRTTAGNIWAAGDVIGPPSLASASMEQGRRVVCHAFGVDPGNSAERLPVGVYTIPEIASVGLTDAQAAARYGGATVGRARFDEVARGQIANNQDGLLKLVADGDGRRLLGVQCVGEGAAELVHVGQMALRAGFDVDVFVEETMNFPTLAEAYRIAALDLLGQRAQRATADVSSSRSAA